MKLYKHYSFDLWLTLIKSDGKFKEKRAEFFRDNYNPEGMSITAITDIFNGLDRLCNVVNEQTELSIDSLEMYAMVLHKLGVNVSDINRKKLENIYDITEDIFLKYPPMLYDENTELVLAKLKLKGASISILSNTAFIKGRTLRKLLTKLNLDNYIDFQIYSDEENLSKPSQALFDKTVLSVYELRTQPIQIDHIIHVGDNPNADGQGAKSAGIDYFIINSNDKTIKDILI